jgi:hypothetical protein
MHQVAYQSSNSAPWYAKTADKGSSEVADQESRQATHQQGPNQVTCYQEADKGADEAADHENPNTEANKVSYESANTSADKNQGSGEVADQGSGKFANQGSGGHDSHQGPREGDDPMANQEAYEIPAHGRGGHEPAGQH